MPNRIIKESICTSDNVDQLSAFEETFFYRLIVNCDDYGRMDARAKILASKLYPLKDIRSTQIESALRALTSAELVILYEVDGKPFLQMKTWDRHQQVRAKKSKYPSPESGKRTNDSICNQMISDDSKCLRNPIQSNPNPNPNPNGSAEQSSTPAVEQLPLNDGSQFDISQEYIDEMKRLYPAVDVLQQIRSMRGWLINNPARRKTKKGITKFINTWLSKEQDKGHYQTGQKQKQVSAQQYDQRDYSGEQDDAMRRFLEMNGGQTG